MRVVLAVPVGCGALAGATLDLDGSGLLSPLCASFKTTDVIPCRRAGVRLAPGSTVAVSLTEHETSTRVPNGGHCPSRPAPLGC